MFPFCSALRWSAVIDFHYRLATDNTGLYSDLDWPNYQFVAAHHERGGMADDIREQGVCNGIA